MKFIEVNKEEYVRFLQNLSDEYIYIPNMIADRTDIVEKANTQNRIATRFIGQYGDLDTYEIREDFCN